MADDKAKQIVKLYETEKAKIMGFWSALWQDAADYSYPREDCIDAQRPVGEDKSVKLYDDTAVFDSQEMASGLSSALFPTGQKAFGIKFKNREIGNIDRVRRWALAATETLHDELYESNFMLHLNECLRGGCAVFGTGNLFSEWDTKHRQLNFRDFPVPMFLIKEDSRGNVDTCITSYTMTARQAYERWGTKCSPEILKEVEQFETESKEHVFIHYCGPRNDRNPMFKDAQNMPWASIYVDAKAALVVEETGFDEMPYHVFRWMKGGNEKYGRGQSTEALASLRRIQKVWKDFVDLCNRFCDPPLEVLDTFEGKPKTYPGALNYVGQFPSIKGLEQSVLGNFPATEKIVEMLREEIHKRYFRDIFVQISDLQGDRRTTVEIRARMQEGLRRLAAPVARLQSELLTPLIVRCLMLLVRNGRIPYPPPEAVGQNYGIEYMGPLALALQNQQAQGFVRWAGDAIQLAQAFPAVLDLVNIDSGFRRYGENLGVNVDDVNSDATVAALRKARAEQAAQQQAVEQAAMQAKTFKDTSAAPEAGSPAAELVGAGR